LHYIAENIQDQLPVHDFIAKEWNKKIEVDFEKWLRSYDISLSFKIEKNHCMKRVGV
jgi:hypothetical protein